MSNSLVSPSDLQGFPGAPFSDDLVDAAAGGLRDECGWHIAPAETHTVKVRPVGCRLFLRTLRLVDVLSVVDRSGADVEVEDFDEDTGVVWLARAPQGRVTVNFKHGFERCPPALMGAIADRVQRAARSWVRQESAGSLSLSYGSGADSELRDSVARYKLGTRP